MSGTLNISEKQAKVLDLLTARGDSYGLELVRESGGALKRGTVYVTLDRMEDKGLIKSWLEDAPAGQQGPQRRKYRATGHGAVALASFCERMTTSFTGIRAAGFVLPSASKIRFVVSAVIAVLGILTLNYVEKIARRRPLRWLVPELGTNWTYKLVSPERVLNYLLWFATAWFRDMRPNSLVPVTGILTESPSKVWLSPTSKGGTKHPMKGVYWSESFDEMLMVTEGSDPIRIPLGGSWHAEAPLVHPAPGARLMQALRARRGKKYVARVLEPVYMDFWHEYAEAVAEGELVRARWIRAKFYWDFARTIGLFGALKSVAHFVREIAAVFKTPS